MKHRKGIAATAASLLTVTGVAILPTAALGESGELTEYVPVEDIVVTTDSDEESESYNSWHFDPNNEVADSVLDARNGMVIQAGDRVLVREGNGNDVVASDGDLVDETSVADLIGSLDLVSSDNSAVHYQIAIFYNYDEEADSWGFTTLRQLTNSTDDLWTSSGVIDDPATEGVDVPRNVPTDLETITTALDAFEDARPISAGFLVDKVDTDVLISSFSVNGSTTYFYGEPTVDAGYVGVDELILDADKIRPNEDTYPGWHDSATQYPDDTFEIVQEDGVTVGLKLDGHVQIINGFEEDAFIQNRVDLAETLKVDVLPGSDTVYAQIPLFFYNDGVLGSHGRDGGVTGQQFTTLRAVLPESGSFADAEAWVSSGNIVGSDGVLIERNKEYSFDEIAAALGDHEILAYGFSTAGGTATIASVEFDGVTTTFSETVVTPTAPVIDNNTITIPVVEGVEYLVDGVVVSGEVVISADTTVTARAVEGFVLAEDAVASWDFTYVAPAPEEIPNGNVFFLSNTWDSHTHDVVFAYGRAGDEVFVGDWDGDGYDTLAVRRGKTFFVNNELRGGVADAEFNYGRLGDEVFVGDWDGDGYDTFGVRRGNTFYLMNDLDGGNADIEFDYGRIADEVFVGDWDADDVDTITVRRGNKFFVNNDLVGGHASIEYNYGRVNDAVFAGDFDGDGYDTVSVRRGNVFFVNNELRGGKAESEIAYGRVTDTVLIGDWDGDGIDTPAVNRVVRK